MSYLANGKELTTTEDAILETIAALTTPLWGLRINAAGNGVEWAAISGGASPALDNLASVAINTTLVSDTDNTDALGTLNIAWSDLFLGNGAVINFTSSAGVSDVTITHSSNTLTLAGGDLIMATSLGATGTRVLKGWFTDLESSNMPTVGGTAILTSLTAPQFTTIELGHATDTTISRASAGNLAIEGNLVYRAGGTDVPVADGGTGLSSISALSILVANSANTFVAVTPGAGNSIRVNAGGTAWEAFTPSASVPTTITVANEATDTTCFPLFVTAATGDLGPKTVASFTLNSNTGALGITSIELGHASDTSITRASAGVIAVEGKNVYMAGGTDVALADGGTGASLSDPNADRIMFWDDSAGAIDWLAPSTGLAITTTSIAVDQTTAFAWTGAHTWTKAGVLNTLTNTTDSASVQVMILEGDRATMAANDEAYITLRLSDSAGNQDEQARITWKATTITNGATQDGQIIFSTLLDNVLTTILTLGGASSASTFAGNLSIGTTNAFTTGTIELGAASDTTLARVSAGVVSIEGVNIVTVSSTDTLSNKTLTAPKIANAGFIADANGNEQLIFTTTASAVNEMTHANAATGNNPSITASGGDANVGLDFVLKGSGTLNIKGNSTQAGTLRLYEDTDDGSNYTSFKVGTQSADISYVLPTAQGAASTYLKNDGSGNLSWATVSGGDVYALTAVPTTYFTYTIPWFARADAGSDDNASGWQNTGYSASSDFSGVFGMFITNTTNNAWYSYDNSGNGAFPGTGSTVGHTFASSKKTVLSFRFKGDSTGNWFVGLGTGTNANWYTASTSSSGGHRAGFGYNGTNFRSITDNGTSVTTNTITATVTNWNTLRIEFDPGSACRFYLNGTLQFTHSTNLPTTGVMLIGHGHSATGKTYYMSNPVISIEI